MEVMFIMLFIPAAIVYFRNPRDEATRWLSFFLVCSASGSFSHILRRHVIPGLNSQSLWSLIIQVVRFNLYFISHHIFHYGLLMYAIVYSLGSSFKYKKVLSFILLIPLILSLCFMPWQNYSIQLEMISYFLWTTAYDLCAAGLILYAYKKETNIVIKKSRFNNALVIVPTIFAIILFINIRNTFSPSSMINRTILVFVAYSFILFMVLALKSGVLGVKIQIRNHILSSTARVTANGTDIINHTIKDEMNKMRMIIDRIRLEPEDKEKEEILGEFSRIYSATDQVLEFVDRIRDQTQDIELRKEWVSVPRFIQESLDEVTPLITDQDVKIVQNLNYTGNLICDPLYIRAVLKNIFKNSLEAIEGKKGYIKIEAYKSKRKIYISVRDSGCGISSEILNKVKDPFFSTKNNKYNYGLGLNFCSNVMQKHGGVLEILSEGKGATVILIFPQ